MSEILLLNYSYTDFYFLLFEMFPSKG